MSLNLSVNLEAYPKDIELGIEGLGRLTNGGDSLEITPEMEEAYFNRTGYKVEVLKEQEGYTLTGSPSWTPPETDDTVEDVTENTTTVSDTPVVNDSGQPTGLPQEDDK